jgi:hypothetical protein
MFKKQQQQLWMRNCCCCFRCSYITLAPYMNWTLYNFYIYISEHSYCYSASLFNVEKKFIYICIYFKSYFISSHCCSSLFTGFRHLLLKSMWKWFFFFLSFCFFGARCISICGHFSNAFAHRWVSFNFSIQHLLSRNRFETRKAICIYGRLTSSRKAIERENCFTFFFIMMKEWNVFVLIFYLFYFLSPFFFLFFIKSQPIEIFILWKLTFCAAWKISWRNKLKYIFAHK